MPPSRLPQLLPTVRDLPALAVLFVAYWAMAVGSLQFAVTPGAGVAFWPGAGVAFAAMALGGVRLWPAVFLGRLMAGVAVASAQPLWIAAIFAAATTLGSVIPLLLMGGKRLNPHLNSLGDMARLVVLGGLAGAVISALLAMPAMMVTAGSLMGAADGALAWAFGFATGVLLLAPPILVWSLPESWRARPKEWLHLGACLMAVWAVAMIALMMGPGQTVVRTWHLYPMLVWAALAFNVRGASLALLISSGLAIYGAVTGVGVLGRQAGDGAARLLLVQQFVISSAMTTLFLAAVADERRGRARLERQEALLRAEIAERTRAEEHQRLLVHELNHRVKNTLATVQSIAAQTKRSRDLQAGYDSFTSRLVALSRAHDVLTRQSWEGADLRAMAQGAFEPFETTADERFHLSGPQVWLDPQRALALAMALHELATNAAKYGALSRPEGQVTLDWATDGEGGLTLTWREAGGPPVREPTHKGFGSRLLQRGLAAEMGGDVQVDYRPDGLVCVITAPAPEPRPGADADRA